MSSTDIAFSVRHCVPLLAAAAIVVGCASGRHDTSRDIFSATAPFSKTVSGSGDAVCWSVGSGPAQSSGYMYAGLDPPDVSVLTGTRVYRFRTSKLNVSITSANQLL